MDKLTTLSEVEHTAFATAVVLAVMQSGLETTIHAMYKSLGEGDWIEELKSQVLTEASKMQVSISGKHEKNDFMHSALQALSGTFNGAIAKARSGN